MVMQDLSTIGIQQPDAGTYGGKLTLDGTVNYEKTNYGGPFFELDLLVSSRFINQLRNAKEKGKPLGRHIDVGTGPNILPAIMSSPYVDKFISIEKSPSNIARLNQVTHGEGELPEYWKAWKDVCVVMYGIGSAEKLDALSRNESVLITTDKGKELTGVQIFESLQNWGINKERLGELENDRQHAGRTTAHIVPDDVKKAIWKQFVGPDNPYANIDLKQHLKQKFKVVEGDVFEGVSALEGYEGSANILTKFYVTESITADRRIFAHGEVNWLKLAVDKGKGNPKENAEIFSAHDEKTVAYDTFYSEEEIKQNPLATLEELRATRGYFVAKAKPMIDFHQGVPQGGIVHSGTEGRGGFRDDTGIAVISGTANYKNPDGTDKFNDGLELLKHALPDIDHTHHQLEFAKREKEDAVHDARQYSEKFAISMGKIQKSNKDALWDELGSKFWDSYAGKNYDQPLVADLEGMLSVIQNMRGQAGRTYLDVGTGSAPQYALAAVLAGMGNVIVSDYAEGAIKWLNRELLDDNPLSPRTQMWVDITRLLSTFKDRDELVAYCADTGFDRRLHNWETLPAREKEEWFDDRRGVLTINGVKNSFIDDNYDIKHKIKTMSENGTFEIRKFSIYEPPQDIVGKVDIVTAMYIAESITGVPSESCDGLLKICSLARPKTGVVDLGQNIYADWKSYEGTAMDLPALSRPHSYVSASSSLLFESDCATNRKNNVYKEKNATRTGRASSMIWPVISSVPTDSRLEYLTQTSGTPRELLYKTGEEMLAELHIKLLESAKDLLLIDPGRRNVSPDSHWKNLDDIEEALGASPPPLGTIYSRSPGVKRQLMADRIDNIITHMRLPENARDADTMNKHDKLFSEFLHGLYKDLVGRSGGMQMSL